MLPRSLLLLALSTAFVLTSASSTQSDAAESTKPVSLSSSAPSERSSTTLEGLHKAVGDTFRLYGGPGTNEGKFQDPSGAAPDRQGWIGVDNTDKPNYWQISTFNAENLGGHGVGNHAMWCGLDASQQPGWVSAPGYGNNWDTVLVFDSGPIADPSQGQTVSLEFLFNYETTPTFDNLFVEYEADGAWYTVMAVSGTNKDTFGFFPAPGDFFSTHAYDAITYRPNRYGGPSSDRVRIRLRFSSDAVDSDQDGGFTSTAGAVQVDDLHVVWSDGEDLQTFEDGTLGAYWSRERVPFVGDFSRVWPSLRDGTLNPCQENASPAMAFVDAGQEVGNASSAAEIPGYATSTGGVTSSTWNYGVPGGWVVNNRGGLAENATRTASTLSAALDNEVWSPEISWDLPGPTDDDPDIIGARLDFDVLAHLPFSNGVFFTWWVRSLGPTSEWTPWQNDSQIYFTEDGLPKWQRRSYDITPYLEFGQQTVSVQVSFEVVDLADFFWQPGADSTPSPAFDNVSLVKYRVGGPLVTARTIDLAQSGFPVGGGLDASTQSSRDALDIPFDMANDVGAPGGTVIDPGDSIIADVESIVPGTMLSDLRMVWVLDKNPLFEDAIRSAPSRPQDLDVITSPTQWSGAVLADSTYDPTGRPFANRFAFDLPDVDFLYPGDVLRYYLQATDSDGRVSTLPTDTSGFLSGVNFDRQFTVRGLPSLADAAGTQPSKLLLDDSGSEQERATLLNAMRMLGFVEGQDFDVYAPNSPGHYVSQGIGSSGGHGATAPQLAGYDTIVYTSGERTQGLMSDGSFIGFNDKSDDLGLLTAWHALAGSRNVAYFGSSLASGLSGQSSDGAVYVSSVLATSVNDTNVRDELQGQSTPRVQPVDPIFSGAFAVAAGCPAPHELDSVTPLPGASAGHLYLDPAGTIITGPAASVVHDRFEGADRKVDLLLPYPIADLQSWMSKAPGSTTAATELLREVFTYFAVPSGGGTVGAPMAQHFTLAVAPNPFNPRTLIRLSGVREGDRGSVRIYDLRGALVATLADGTLDQRPFIWEGVDDKGRAVSSGVYLVDARSGDQRQTRKVALVR